GTRFFPEDLDILVSANMQQIARAPLTRRFPAHAELVFTCDEDRREVVREEIRWERARRKATLQGGDPSEYYEQSKRREEARAHGVASGPGGGPPRPPSPPRGPNGRAYAEPVFAVATCPLARALGDDDVRRWGRVAGAMSHRDFTRSIA